MTVEDLLCATLVSSANDAACALAYDVSGGDIAAFVEEMNRRAAALGAADTHFTSPAGVYSAQSHTTARDAARIAGAFYNYGRLLEISSLPYYQLGNTMHTKNYLLSEALMKGCTLAGAKGIAAGQAKADGQYCLITAAEAEALTYIFVVMDAAGENRYNDGTRDFPAENAYNDVKKLFPWATSAFGYSMLLSAEDVVGELPVRLSADADFVTVVPAEPIDRRRGAAAALKHDAKRDGNDRLASFFAVEAEHAHAVAALVGDNQPLAADGEVARPAAPAGKAAQQNRPVRGRLADGDDVVAPQGDEQQSAVLRQTDGARVALARAGERGRAQRGETAVRVVEFGD